MNHRGILLMSLGLAACATSTGRGSAGLSNTKTKGGFPTREALAEVRALDATLEGNAVADVESWEFVGPFPPDYGNTLHQDAQLWSKYLVQLYQTSQGQARPTPGMNCAARELARFLLIHEKAPSLALQRDLAARCKTLMTSFAYSTLTFDLPPEWDDHKVWDHAEQQVAQMVRPAVRGPLATGLTYHREGNRGMFIFAYARRTIAIRSVTRSQGGYRVDGEFVGPIASQRTLATVGTYGAAECGIVVNAQRPRFVVECPMAADDDAAWIEVATFEPGAVFGTMGAAIRVHPSGAAPAPYRRPELGQQVQASSAAELTGRLLELANEVRQQAGRAPLTIDLTQSSEASQFVVPYFASLLGRLDPMVAETVALGLRAGWSVEDTVRYGQVGSAISVGVPNLATLLAGIIDGPFGRMVLLDPEAKRVAIGPLFEASSDLYGVLLATYALFETPAADLRTQVLESISAARASAGRQKPAMMAPNLEAAILKADEAIMTGASAEDALDALMRTTANALKTGVGGYYVETTDLEQIQWPQGLITSDARVVISVGHRQPDDEPWGRYVVIIAYEKTAPTTTTALPSAPSRLAAR
ncbi:MAG: hypothetical protein RMA76_20085 [Deltaproteobacteria bacterium]